MKKMFESKNINKNHNNFYHIKEIQWSNRAMKKNQINVNNADKIQKKNSIKENLWNKRFIYNKIQNYDSSKDKNVIAAISKNEEMNCYHNAIKKNEIIKKSFYQNNQNKKKNNEEYNKTKIRIRLNPLGRFIKKNKLMHNSFSNNSIYFKNNKTLLSDLIQNKSEINKNLFNNENNSPDKLSKIWKDLCILEPYCELFNLLTTQLSPESKEDFCEREFNDLFELKNNLRFLSTSVFYRIKTLENLSSLNDKLGDILQNKQSESKEIILKKISKNIKNLREHTVNICFLMQKIKLKINQNYPWGKYDLNAIAEKFKFDKNYLIKMKEEMCVLKEGFIKYFFNISDDSDLFLLNASEPENKNNKQNDPFLHYVPLSNKMREKINQCIYIIYQELIGYQNNNMLENNFRNISPLKNYIYSEIDVKTYKKYNETFNSSISNNSSINLLLQRNGSLSPVRTMYSGMIKTNKNEINNKRILSGNDKENFSFNKYFNKLDKNLNEQEGKAITNNNNNNDIKDLLEKNDKEEIKENIKKINNENYEDDININNISNIKKEDIFTKSEKDDFDFNYTPNNKIKEEIVENIEINKSNEKEKEKGIIKITKDSNINNKLEEIIEEEKFKNESIKLDNNNSKNNKIDDDIIQGEKIEEEKKEENDNKKIDDNNISNKNNNENDINEEKEKEKMEDILLDSLKIENEEKKEIESKNSKTNNTINKSSETLSIIKSKNLKIDIFSKDIGSFSKDIYNYYYPSIPQIIKEMFKIEQDIFFNILNGVSPYILLVHKNTPNSEEVKDIMGICIFNFQYKNKIIKLVINHISTNNNENQTELDLNQIEQIKQIFKSMILYIKKNFYFDEIIIEYNNDKVNNNLLNIFLEDLNFVVIDENENENGNGKINQQGENINKYCNKIIYTNDSTKNRVNDLVRQSIQKYLGKNVLDIFNCVLIANRKENINSKMNEENIVNNVLSKYLMNKKEIANINRIYNKITNLDQLIKLFQNNNINTKEEIPLSLAENICDISSTAINRTTFNNYFNNLTWFNNYNSNYASSVLDKNNNIYYNYIKGEKTLLIKNEEFNIEFCHLFSNNLCLFFCNANDELNSYLNKNNIYTQINKIYKDTLKKNKKFVLNDKILWIPCFNIYKHIKTLTNNSSGTIHEYIKISNQKIQNLNREFLKINNENINKENNLMKIEPDLDRDFILDDDFIFGIINNAEILKVKFEEKNNIEEEKKDEESISEEIEGEGEEDLNKFKNEPYIIFLSYVKKSDFIRE